MNANRLVVFDRLAGLEVESIERYHLQVLDLHEHLNLAAKSEHGHAALLAVSEHELVLLQTHEHVGDLVDGHTLGVSFVEASYAIGREGALDLVVVVAHVELLFVISGYVRAEGPFVLLVEVFEVALGFEELDDLGFNRGVREVLLYTHI